MSKIKKIKQESVMKEYKFNILYTESGYGFVYAKNPKDAEKRIRAEQWEDIMDSEMQEVLEVTDIELCEEGD